VLEAKATSPLTRLACRDALQARLKPLFNTSVLTALARKPRADGFYRESYSSNPETLAEELNEDYRRDRPWNPVVSQQLAFRQARGSHFMSVWRVRRHLEDEKDLRLYDIHAFLHDGNDQPIGRVALSLAISQKSPDTVQMARAFDTKDEPDLREIGLGLVREEKEGLLLGEDLGALLIVRSWEVHEASRRQGLGKLLLNEAARLGCRNLRTPTFATMRFQPYSQIEPLFDDWPAGYLPDLQEPYVELGMIAKHCVSSDTYLGKTVGHIYPAPYVWQCHAHPGVQLVALGALLAGAWN
jgi:ribosomal protein S18 acetylase RimI-like enzyme